MLINNWPARTFWNGCHSLFRISEWSNGRVLIELSKNAFSSSKAILIWSSNDQLYRLTVLELSRPFCPTLSRQSPPSHCFRQRSVHSPSLSPHHASSGARLWRTPGRPPPMLRGRRYPCHHQPRLPRTTQGLAAAPHIHTGFSRAKQMPDLKYTAVASL